MNSVAKYKEEHSLSFRQLAKLFQVSVGKAWQLCEERPSQIISLSLAAQIERRTQGEITVNSLVSDLSKKKGEV